MWVFMQQQVVKQIKSKSKSVCPLWTIMKFIDSIKVSGNFNLFLAIFYSVFKITIVNLHW